MQPERDTKLPRATLKVEFRHSLEPSPPTQGLTPKGDVEDIEMFEEMALGDCVTLKQCGNTLQNKATIGSSRDSVGENQIHYFTYMTRQRPL